MQIGEIYCSEEKMLIREIKYVTNSTIKFKNLKTTVKRTCHINDFPKSIKIEKKNQLDICNVVMDNFMIYDYVSGTAITTAMLKKGRSSSERITCKNNIVVYDKNKIYKCENVQISLNKTTDSVEIIYKKLDKLYNILSGS